MKTPFAGSSVDFSQMSTLGDIARYHARERGSATALTFEGRETGFAEFDRRANQVANALIAEGVGKGQRIAYVGKNSDHYFELLFGAAKMGAVMTPIGWRLAPAEAAYIVEDSGAPIVFVGPEVIGHAGEVASFWPSRLRLWPWSPAATAAHSMRTGATPPPTPIRR